MSIDKLKQRKIALNIILGIISLPILLCGLFFGLLFCEIIKFDDKANKERGAY